MDLSNFNTSSVNSIGSICFENKSIVYIKFNLLKINEGTHYDDMFSHSSSYLKICINNEDAKNKLPSDIKSKINCLHDCFIIDDVKIDLKNNLCIKYCNESDNKYELNNICYGICPNTSYLSNYNEYLCLDKSSEDNYYFDNNKNVYKNAITLVKVARKKVMKQIIIVLNVIIIIQ